MVNHLIYRSLDYFSALRSRLWNHCKTFCRVFAADQRFLKATICIFQVIAAVGVGFFVNQIHHREIETQWTLNSGPSQSIFEIALTRYGYQIDKRDQKRFQVLRSLPVTSAKQYSIWISADGNYVCLYFHDWIVFFRASERGSRPQTPVRGDWVSYGRGWSGFQGILTDFERGRWEDSRIPSSPYDSKEIRY